MSLDGALIAQIVRNPSTFTELQAAGITQEDFVDEWQKVWRYINRMKRERDIIPSGDQLAHRFEWIELPKTRKRDLPIQLTDLKRRTEHNQLVHILRDAADMLGDPDDIDEAKAFLLSRVNGLSVRNGKSAIRDLFGEDVRREMLTELRRRKSTETVGIPTGLHKFDSICGGMVKGRFITTLARTGVGKTFINLLFVREAVISGSTVMLFPLEMTLFETATRLYTLFSNRVNSGKVLKNMDLQSGQISIKKVVRFLNMLEDHYAGQLYVADVGSIMDPMTVDRIRSEFELHKQVDIGWIDYIQLMRSTANRDARGDERIKELSNGCKGMAQNFDIVMGCSAQANREATRGGFLLPTADHVGLGDSIGQDSDQIVSLARKGKCLFYGVTKNRHGPQIGKTRLKFFPNEGLITEADMENQDDEET